MKTWFTTNWSCCLVALLLASPGWTQAPPLAKGQLRLPEFATLADKASESVAVSLDPQLLALACRFLNSSDPKNGDPEQAEVLKLCKSLTGIYVRAYTFDSDYAYPKVDIDGIRKQLSGPGWSRLVEARSRKEQTDVDVYVLIDGGRARSLAIIASEPREFAIVNILGNIDLEQLHSLEGKLGVPQLGIETGKKVPPEKSPAPKK
jgi:hypothetical protein